MELSTSLRYSALLSLVCLLVLSCQPSPRLPQQAVSVSEKPQIYPDYHDSLLLPCNIAPLNFMSTDEKVTACVARLTSGTKSFVYGGTRKICIDLQEWQMLLAEQGDIQVEYYEERPEGWIAYPSWHWTVSADSIDRYVSYRLIPPSYVMYEKLSIRQRDLSTFDERILYRNDLLDEGRATHCINCHAFQNHRTQRWQMHVREAHGGTVIADGGTLVKRSLKRASTLGEGAYPAWHPQRNLLAYSTNRTMQHFHSADTRKVEVQDSRSDLILYDVARDSVVALPQTPLQLEVFPTWSPDGQWLYYGMARVPFDDHLDAGTQKELMSRFIESDEFAQSYIISQYDRIFYDIYRRPFDAATSSLGEPECVVEASRDSLSLTVPRISPDGRWLLTTVGPYGCFHIWHPEADLMLTDLTTGESHRLERANSDRAESFHNWSDNGRWIVFTSRRDDGNFTRLYLAHIDQEGNASQAFMMPQADPAHELYSTLSYNVPELTLEAVSLSPDEVSEALR